MRCQTHDRFEDGTLNFQGIVALRHGFETIARFGGMDAIRRYTFTLASRLHERLASLNHDNGQPLCTIHGWRDATPDKQGAIVAFSLQRCGCSLLVALSWHR
jgi:selenocysteine lyase/cysteine desulfurase